MENYISDAAAWNSQLMQQSALESQLAAIPNQQLFQQDEDDVFQCGKCKLILPSIIDFMIHKREHNSYDGNDNDTEQQSTVISNNNSHHTVSDVMVPSAEVVPLEGLVTLEGNENQIWLWSHNNVSEGCFGQTEVTEVEPSTIDSMTQQGSDSTVMMDTEVVELPVGEIQQQDVTTAMIISKPDVEDHSAIVDTTNAIVTTTKSQNFVCTMCGKEFSKQSDYMQHYRIHTGEKPFQCLICGRTFAQKSNKKKHMSTHKIWPNDLSKTIPPPTTSSGEQTLQQRIDYKCPFCDLSYPSYFNLKAHLSSHKDRKVFKCIQTHCDAMFYDEKSLLNHVAESHPVPLYRCHVCSMHSNSLQDFAEHQKIHTDHALNNTETPKQYRHGNSCRPKEKYRCLVCRVSFRTPESLANHSATATHRHECHVCQKNYTSARYLRRHLLVHNTTVTYTCPVCEKSFQSLTSFKTHKETHNPTKAFHCSQCHMSFSRKDKLKRHALIHQPTKKLKCPFAGYFGCTKEFHRQDKLKRHLLTHTKVGKKKNNSRGHSGTKKISSNTTTSSNNSKSLKSLSKEQMNKNVLTENDRVHDDIVDDVNEETAMVGDGVNTVEILVVPLLTENWSDEPIRITCPSSDNSIT